MERSKQSMIPRRLLTIALVLALGLPTVFSLLPGCDKTPAEPEFQNPFDPAGPDEGDPLQVRVEASPVQDNTLQITWNQPQNMGLTHYVISGTDNLESNWTEIGSKDHTTAPTSNLPYTNPDPPTSTHWFRVQAFAGGNFSITSYAQLDSITVGPRVVLSNGGNTTATRFSDLDITVNQGDQLRIALDPTFTDSLMIVPAEAPDVPKTVRIDLGPATRNGETRTVYVVSFADGYESEVSSKTIEVYFHPGFRVDSETETLSKRTVDLLVPTEGVLDMRFFPEWADTATTPWVPVADTFTGYELSDSANPQFIRAQFRGDFGFDEEVELQVVPDLLENVTFSLDLEEDHITEQSTVTGTSSAVATEMRYSESADFTGAPWITYAAEVDINLSPTPGHKVIHVQYRNDWTHSGVLTDYVIHVTQPAEVSFWAPRDGDVVLGGTSFQVRGSSTVGSGEGSVALVGFDGGDGNGFVDVTGTDTWSHDWNVPLFTTDTQLTLRAKAWYGAHTDLDSLETVTTAITVTVTQMAVTITNPVAGETFTPNRTYSFSGTASGILGVAALEEVIVHVGTDTLAVSGDSNWSADWTAPIPDIDTTLTMTATAVAGGNTAVTSIDLDVVRTPVVIVTHRDEDLVNGNTAEEIQVRTFADLFSVPVESVTVDIAWSDTATTLPATLTDDWTVTWDTPPVMDSFSTEIIATAIAGGESHADTVTVTLTP